MEQKELQELKKLIKIEVPVCKKEKVVVTKTRPKIKRPKKKLVPVKTENKNEIINKLVENNQKIKDFGQTIRKQNLKFKTKRFMPDSP